MIAIRQMRQMYWLSSVLFQYPHRLMNVRTKRTSTPQDDSYLSRNRQASQNPEEER